MRQRQRVVSVLAFGLAAVLAAVYFQQRDLPGRYRAYQQRQEQIRQAEAQVAALEATLKTGQEHADNLGTDPVEVEAAIRRVKRMVRDGETIFRIEEVSEAAPAAPAPAAPADGTIGP